MVVVGIIVGVQQQLNKVGELSIKVGDDKITNTAVVKNLGVYIDSELKLSTHVNKIVSSLNRPEIKTFLQYNPL